MNLLPVGDFPNGLPVFIQPGTLEITEMANVVGGPIGALEPQSGLVRLGQMHAAWKDQVEDNRAARFCFAPDPKVLIELLMEPLGSRSRPNREAHRAG